MGRLTLASRSPQRRRILEQLGVEFTVVEPSVEEIETGDPALLVVENAVAKARSVGADPVLGVDTTVVLDGRSYGKPPDPEGARAVLELLSGRSHEVLSGVCVRRGSSERTAVERTVVRFRELSSSLLDWYLASGEWRERAGGYAIQGRGAALVESIDGDFWNVVGLPVAALLDLCPELLPAPR